MTDAKNQLVRSWLIRAKHDLTAAEGLYKFALSLLPAEVQPG